MSTQFEPKIIAFLCNWCGYAGADLAGTSRIEYPTNIRIIRVMCSGRVNPAFIFSAFEMGADGVLVVGCHPGDCHYKFGNYKAEEKVGVTKKLLGLVGFGSERLRLEWISASEGQKFAETVRSFRETLSKMGPNILKPYAEVETGRVKVSTQETLWNLIKRTKFLYCQECGKCSSSCPITRITPQYSPRIFVEKALMGLEKDIILDKGLWSCLTCYLCRQRCPLDIEYDEFIRACRAQAMTSGVTGQCAHGGTLLALSRLMATPSINQNRLGWLQEGAKVSKSGELLYFVGCLPYFDELFKDIKVSSVEIARSFIKVLNRAGIEPALLGSERCCGHDLHFNGDRENFEKLAKVNVAMIRESGVSRVVTTCAECYRTLKQDYAELLGELGFDVLHASQFLADLIDKGKIKFEEKFDKKVVYHDPCRLGRHMGVYEEPRKVITSIPGVELMEMERNRENSLCCGVSAWMNCGKSSKLIQVERMREAKVTGADWLITTCPKCQIHLNCAMSEKLPVKPEEVTVETCDLSVLLARAMNLK